MPRERNDLSTLSTKVMTVKALTGVYVLTRQIIYCLNVPRNLLEENYKSWSTLATLIVLLYFRSFI